MEELQAIDVLDATKVKEFMTCERKFFFSHVLGWRPEAINNHLIFGSSVHIAMDYIMRKWHEIRKNSDEDNIPIIQEAYNLFLNDYRKHIGPDEDERNAPKAPGYVPKMLVDYIKRYKYLDDFDVLYTEVAGSVPVDFREDGNPIILHFRLDTIVESSKGIYVLEHKTASRFSRPWIDQWKLSTQIDVYTHVLYSMFPRDKVWGAEVNGIALKKNEQHEFMRVPVRKKPEAMNAWLWEIREWLKRIETERGKLEETSVEDLAMMAYPKNPESCTKYFGCEFLPYCYSWGNPLQHIDKPPIGFKVEFWDPREYEEEDGATVKHLAEES